jgi:hypothetical protein
MSQTSSSAQDVPVQQYHQLRADVQRYEQVNRLYSRNRLPNKYSFEVLEQGQLRPELFASPKRNKKKAQNFWKRRTTIILQRIRGYSDRQNFTHSAEKHVLENYQQSQNRNAVKNYWQYLSAKFHWSNLRVQSEAYVQSSRQDLNKFCLQIPRRNLDSASLQNYWQHQNSGSPRRPRLFQELGLRAYFGHLFLSEHQYPQQLSVLRLPN